MLGDYPELYETHRPYTKPSVRICQDIAIRKINERIHDNYIGRMIKHKNYGKSVRTRLLTLMNKTEKGT